MSVTKEKAQSMMSKWWLMKRSLYVRDPDEPPPLIEDCNSIHECSRWRQTVMKDIGEKMAEIQNAELGEFRIRALNDELNKLLNFKRMWEQRIKHLGGQDFTRKEASFYDSAGLLLPGSGNYRYFGAAKDLPGVRELFFKPLPPPPAPDIETLASNLNFDYFSKLSLNSEEQNEILYLESKIKKSLCRKWIEKNKSFLLEKYPHLFSLSEEKIEAILKSETLAENTLQNNTFDTNETDILKNKKTELINKYVYNENDKKEDINSKTDLPVEIYNIY